MAGVPPDAPCLICGRPQDDVLHGPERTRMPVESGRIPHHDYDPGERRKGIRRGKDRSDKAWDDAEKHRRLTDWNREHPKK